MGVTKLLEYSSKENVILIGFGCQSNRKGHLKLSQWYCIFDQIGVIEIIQNDVI